MLGRLASALAGAATTAAGLLTAGSGVRSVRGSGLTCLGALSFAAGSVFCVLAVTAGVGALTLARVATQGRDALGLVLAGVESATYALTARSDVAW